MIELWCLSEWATTALPGKQKNIYLDKCKEKYIGSKTKTTEDEVTKTILNKTGKFKNKYQDLDSGSLSFSFNNSSDYNLDHKINTVCDGIELREFNCGKYYELTPDIIAEKILIKTDSPIINSDYVVKISYGNLKEEITFLQNDIENSINKVKEAKIKEKRLLKSPSSKKKKNKKEKRELKEKYKPEPHGMVQVFL